MTQTNEKTVKDPLETFHKLQQELADQGYELILRKQPTKDVVAFDFGLIFTAGSNEAQLYVDDMLRDVLHTLADENGQILVKVNWFSPDVMLVKASENPDPLQNTPDTDTAEAALMALRATQSDDSTESEP